MIIDEEGITLEPREVRKALAHWVWSNTGIVIPDDAEVRQGPLLSELEPVDFQFEVPDDMEVE